MTSANDPKNHGDYKNLSQLYNYMGRRWHHKKFIQLLIEKLDDINYQIPASQFLELHKPELIGCTALHLAFRKKDNFESFNLLLEYHADPNIKNHEGKTVLEEIIEKSFVEQELKKLKKYLKEYDEKTTIDDVNGFIVMKRIIEGKNFFKHDNWRLWGKFEDKYVDSILSNCVANEIIPKYSNNDGISYFHAACLTNNMKAFDFFLKNGANVNEISSSPIFVGFTPLHFSVKYGDVKMVKILLENGVNIFSNDSRFMSPVDMLVDQNLKIIEWLHAKNELPYNNSIDDYFENEEKINMIIEKNYNSLSDYLVTTLIDTFLERDHWNIHEGVLTDFWSGYSKLHLASFFNVDKAKILISKGFEIETKNKNGVTALNILETRATVEDLYFIVSDKESWKSVTLSDEKTKLLDLILSMKNLSNFENFLNEININLSIPNDAPLWPGYTILHLVVTFSETSKKVSFLKNCDKNNSKLEYKKSCEEQERIHLEKIELCLRKNADVTVKDARGWTPINLAFRQRKMNAVNLMLQHHDSNINVTDNDHLSHLHIACIANNQTLIEKLLSNGADVNLAIKSSFKWQCNYYGFSSIDVFDIIGSTPLHLIVSSENFNLSELLLNHEADVNAKDTLGLTPLHRIFILEHLWQDGNGLLDVSIIRNFYYITYFLSRSKNWDLVDEANDILLSSPNLKESIVDDIGLSHLHIAIDRNKFEVAKKLLDLGSDINLKIKSGKELKATNPLSIISRYDGTSVLFDQLENFYYKEKIDFCIVALKDNENLRENLRERFGWTLLHVACRIIDFDLANFAFSIGVNVNLRTKKDSPLHQGCTALHILLKNEKNRRVNKDHHEKILSALLIHGADVMLTDTQGNTAVHLTDYTYGYKLRSSVGTNTNRILKHIKNFNVNPVNYEGLSVFHIACIRNDIDAVTKFLENGVDLNQPIEYFGDLMAGWTPLHLASDCSKINFYSEEEKRRLEHIELQLQVIELLLKHGAEINVKNAFGDTPLHTVAKGDVPKEPFFDLLVRYGADMNVKNIYGETSLEALLSSSQAKAQDVLFFLNHGCRLNSFNEITQVGYLSMAMMECPSIDEISYKGRTAIHNIVSNSEMMQNNDEKAIGYLVEKGCDIDRQDETGMTALHLAARFRNNRGIEGLLIHGVDVNIIDSTNRTAFAWTLESESLRDLTDRCYRNHICDRMTRFIYHMKYRGIYLNEINKRSLITAFEDRYIQRKNIEEDYEKISNVKIENTLFTLNDFFSETGAIVYYSKIPKKEREALEYFFTTTVNERKFHHWDYLCKAQYKKALERPELVENARVAMNVVLGFPLPELCYDVVEKFLGNCDLKNLIGAATIEIA